MHRALILLCLLSAGAAVHSFGTVYKVPSIYTPVSSSNSFVQLNSLPQWQPNAQSNHPLSYPPLYPTQSPLYPPSTLILVYYRAKQQQTQTPSTTPTTTPALVPSPLANVCKGEGVTAHPTDCYKFVSCRLSLNQQVYYYEVRTCPQGLAFDASLETCNYQTRVTNCALTKSPSRRPSATKSPHATQTKLTYHNDLLPEATYDQDKPETVLGEEGSSNPSLYMLDLPQPLLNLDETPKQESQIDQVATSPSSSVVTTKTDKVECDCEKTKAEQSPSTLVVKKTTNIRKSSTTRKVNPKSAKPSVSNGTKSPVQATKSAEASKKQPRVETFSIGDSSESAKMVMAKEDIDEQVASTNPVAEQPAAQVSSDKLVAGVAYEEGNNTNNPESDNADSDDTYSSTV